MTTPQPRIVSERMYFGEWSAPDPRSERLSDALWTATHNLPGLTWEQGQLIVAAAGAFIHFAAHLADTESIVGQLRELRQAVEAFAAAEGR